MRPSVQTAFLGFTQRFEGKVPWMYLDKRGLVTIAYGNLEDPVNCAVGLPFLHPDGRAASITEIANAWSLVKSRKDLIDHGFTAFASLSDLRLSEAGMTHAFSNRLMMNDRILTSRFPKLYEALPADGQLICLSMAWACGPYFYFPHFEAALRASNWDEVATQCHISEVNNPGIIARNRADAVAANNLKVVSTRGLDPNALYWPKAVS